MIIKKTSLLVLVVIFTLAGTEILFRFFLNIKKNFLIKNYDQYIFYNKYSETLHHLRDINFFNEYNNPTDFMFNYLNKIKNSKSTILIMGDSHAESLNKHLKDIQPIIQKNYPNTNIINSGTTSYSPSLMTLQFEVLVNDFFLRPDTVISIINPTDIGDENCRYQSKIIKKNNKLVKIEREVNQKEFYFLENILLLSKIYTDDTFIKIKYLKNIFKNYYNFNLSEAPIKCKFSKIQNYLNNSNEKELSYFKETVVNYIKTLNEYSFVKKIIIVTIPHIQHLDEKVYNLKYKIKISDLVNEIQNENSNLKFYHLDLYENNIFEKFKNNYFEVIIKDDPASHNTALGDKIFFEFLTKKIND